MQLTRAFQIANKEIVAFVGGGGKTTAMFRLAEELVAQGKRVITTTTTRIFAAQIRLAPEFVRIEKETLDTDVIQTALARSGHVLLVGAETGDGKAIGIDPARVKQLSALDGVDAVLIEADGSRMRPFKAPAEHEPVIPEYATLVVPVVGMDILGKPLDDTNVHRDALVAQLAGIAPGTILNTEHIVRVISAAEGGLKNIPSGARVIPLLNKTETESRLVDAQQIARQLLQHHEIQAVAIGALHHTDDPIIELAQRVAAVILAAGGSTRMQGKLKQLLPWGDTTFIGNAVLVAQQSRAAEIVVVTGNRSEEVERETHSIANVRVTHNPAWATGRASSVRSGIQALDPSMAAAIFINADQPFLTAQVLDTIIETFYRTAAPIVVPRYQGETGSPVLFARPLFDEFTPLQGEQGGRDVLQTYRDRVAHVEIEDVHAGTDLDTPEDYQVAVQRKPRAG